MAMTQLPLLPQAAQQYPSTPRLSFAEWLYYLTPTAPPRSKPAPLATALAVGAALQQRGVRCTEGAV